MGFGSSGGGSGSIASSSDVTFNNVADSQLLAYDSATAKWKNKTATPALPRVVALTYTSTLSPNADTSDITTVTLAGNPTINAPLGTVVDGQKIEIHLKQDATGSRTVTWVSNYSFATGLPAPTLSTAASATDILGFRYSAASSKWRFYGIINGF